MSGPQALGRTAWAVPPFYQTLFLSQLRKLDRGTLHLTLPSGQKLRFGQSEESPEDEVAQIQVRSNRFFKRCILFGDIGFGEAYTDGDWETNDLTGVIRWLILNWQNNPGISGSQASRWGIGLMRVLNRLAHLAKDNDHSGSVKNISAHYDLGNPLFESFLDPSLTYSCADYSQGATTLEQAQLDKLDRMARALRVRPEDHILEIGGGWGALAIHLALKYGCRVTTITVSREQLAKIQERIASHGLADRVTARFEDYRRVQGHFDKVVSIEMLEAVGHKHLPEFYATVERVLRPEGLLGVQVITSADSRYAQLRRGVDWTQKHIFPGSLIPSLAALTQAASRTSKLQIFSLYDMGPDYARTLDEWRKRFNRRFPSLQLKGFDDKFGRAWNYYFSYCEAAFAARHISVVQMVYTRPNNGTLT